MKGWLDNFGKADNANDSNVSLSEGFVGLGYDTKGRNYSPAWGGQFEYGGEIAQRGKKIDQILNANKNLDWVKGLYDPNYGSIQIPGQEGRSTHFMESADRRVYPTIRNIDGELKYLGDDAYNYADSTNSYIEFPTDRKAQKFAKNYKRGTGVLDFQHGGSIPGSVGFTYARVAGAAPSKGKYAKKTMASAQGGMLINKDETNIDTGVANKIAGLELQQNPDYQHWKYLQSLPQLRQAPGRGEELMRKGLGYADVATDVMQMGNFIPHPTAQAVGKVGNIAGMIVDGLQGADEAHRGNYLNAGINLASVALPLALGSKTFRRPAMNLRPGDPLYSLTEQATKPYVLNLAKSSTDYLELFSKVKKMKDNSLLFNRALLGALGAETAYDVMSQTSSPNVINSSDIEGVYPNFNIELENPKSQPLPAKTKNVSSVETAKRLADYMNSKSGEKTGEVYGRKSYYPIDGFKNGGGIPSAQTGEEDIKTIDLPEIVVTAYDEQYPFYQSLSNEQKRYINDEGPIGRATRALAKTGKRGQTAKDISKVVRDVQQTGAEFTGIPGTIRFAQDPVKSTEGVGKTLLDLGLMAATPLAPITAPITYGALDGMNPITGEQMFNEQNLQGAFDTLDALGMVGGAAALLKQPVQKGFQLGSKSVGNIVNRSITPIGYDPFTVAAAPLELITPNALKFKPKTYATKNRFDSWRLYNGLDPKFDTFSKNPDGTLAINDFRLEPDDLQKIIDNPKESFGTMEIQPEFNFGGVHGNGWITKGVDEEGRKFIDFTDTWDLQPFAAFSKLPEKIRNFEVSSVSGGKPFDLKNRIYYDDKGNFFDHSGNKLVEEVQHFPKGVAKENEAVDIRMLSTPNVVGTKQTDVLKDWDKATQHKFIKGGLTSGIGVASVMSYLAAALAEKKRLKEDEKKGDDAVKEFQNGGEMKFYQNGLDWKPKSMQEGGKIYEGQELPEFVVEGKDERIKEAMSQGINKFYGHVGELMGAPQKEMMQLVTGKEQTPSQAFGFQNTGGWLDSYSSFGKNLLNTGLDLGLDPVNALGVGLIDDITRGGIRLSAKQAASSAINTKNNLLRAIKGTGSFVDQVKGEVLQGKANRESIKLGNEWLQNWIDNPITRQKIDADIDKAIALKGPDATIDDLNYLELVRNQSKDFMPYSKEYSLYDQLNDNIDQYLRLSNTRLKPMHDKNMGVSQMHGFDPQTRELIARGLMPAHRHYGSFISRKTSIPQVERQYTTIHEGTHDWVPEEVVKKLGMRNIALKNINPEAKKYLLDVEAGLKDQLTDEQKYLGYLADPTEQHARIMELRGNLGLTPDDVVDENLAKEIIKKIKNRETPVDPKFLKVIDSDPLKLAERFNRFWAVPAVGAVVGSQAVDKQKNGGITKDNQGYWNPDNWGKPVEIDSNNITMEGVNQPLLGISDTGDTKLMKPGKNYKFKGKKVTEFPVAKLGINQLDAQPMKKLNQLLNFTNNPDKDNWLDKYN